MFLKTIMHVRKKKDFSCAKKFHFFFSQVLLEKYLRYFSNHPFSSLNAKEKIKPIEGFKSTIFLIFSFT
jgi:hypothetical protein